MNIHPLTHKLLNIEGYTGKYVFINGYVRKDNQGNYDIKGYWERKDGSEGGELLIWANVDEHIVEVLEFDGAYDLPSYVKAELDSEIGVICDW